MPKIPLWRAAFFLSGAALIAGGPRHPSPHLDLPFHESTALMLADPDWTPSHLLMLVSYLLLLLALVLWRTRARPAGAAETWTRLAIAAAAVASVEMAFHAAAVVDLERLRAGGATPVLTAHLWLAVVANPLVGLALGGLAIHAARIGRLGSLWIAWMPVLGGAAYGAAAPYVVLTHDQRVSPMFAIGASLMAFWMLLAAVWPVRAPASAPAPAQALQPQGA